MIQVGPDAKASMVIYFKKSVSDVQISTFISEVPTRPGPDGDGFTLREGIRMMARVFHPVEGHNAISITFFPGATREQREVIRREAEAHPLVYKIIENVAPNDVKKLD